MKIKDFKKLPEQIHEGLDLTLDVEEHNIPHLDRDHENHEARMDSLRIIKKANPELYKRILNWD